MAVFMEPRAPSVAPSDTTYHSFHDVELYETASTPQKKPSNAGSHGSSRSSRHTSDDRPTTAIAMKRQDSGYGSNSVSPRPSTSHSRPAPPRRTSTSNVHTGLRNRTRPSTRRSTKSYNVQQGNTSSLYLVRPSTQHQQQSSNTFFHFPSPDPAAAAPPREPTPAPSLPPQTTHYWTSDRTRRLEYAAIDAASRGVKGWVRRNLVPDCFLASEDQHVAFDDDTGSVRRYRLELEEEPHRDEKALGHGHKGWHFWKHV